MPVAVTGRRGKSLKAFHSIVGYVAGVRHLHSVCGNAEILRGRRVAGRKGVVQSFVELFFAVFLAASTRMFAIQKISDADQEGGSGYQSQHRHGILRVNVQSVKAILVQS